MSYIPPWLTDIASISSIIGLLITIWVLRETKNIRKSFLTKARLPDAIKELESLATNLSKTIPEWETNKQDTLTEISRCMSILKNIEPKLTASIKKDVATILEEFQRKKSIINFWRKKSISELNLDEIWNLYSQLQFVIEGLRQKKHDMRWE
jgi:hypothetical protein